MADLFSAYFQSVFAEGSIGYATVFYDEGPYLCIDVSCCGVPSMLLDIDVKMSVGPDGVPNMFLRKYVETMAKFLVQILQCSLAQCIIPED